jgi:hypothetical protein
VESSHEPAGLGDHYRPRIADRLLASRLHSMPTVVIEGPRACGKTATARRQALSEVLFDTDRAARRLAGLSPDLVLDGRKPRLLDEWQAVPDIWNHVRRASDDGRRPGRFILTGSAVPADDVTRHSGAGRISRVQMRPMTLFESGHSTGAVSLGDLLMSGSVAAAVGGLHLVELIELTCRGGWPGILRDDIDTALGFSRGYISEFTRADIADVEGRRRDPARMESLLRSVARNTATEASLATLAADAGEEDSLHVDTARSYLRMLERLFIVEDLPAWSVRLRSRTRLRRSAKRHFVDPSLAVAALRAGPQRLLADLSLFGLLFESLVIRDLRVYADAHGGDVCHYRDESGLEVDATVEAGDGRWIGCEVKLGALDAVDTAARNLLKLAERVDASVVGPPAKLVVITGVGEYAYERADGVAVVPIAALGP